MVITRYSQHPTQRCRTRHVAVLEDVRLAINALTLAIPNAKNAVVRLRLFGCEVQLLRPPNSRCSQLFVDARLEDNVVFFEVFLRLLQRLVVAAKRRAAVTTDKPRCVMACLQVTLALQHR